MRTKPRASAHFYYKKPGPKRTASCCFVPRTTAFLLRPATAWDAKRTASCCFTSLTAAFYLRPAIARGCGGIIPPHGSKRTAGCCFTSRMTAFSSRPAIVWEREGIIPSQGAKRTADCCFVSCTTAFSFMSRNSMGVWGYNTPAFGGEEINPRRHFRLRSGRASWF